MSIVYTIVATEDESFVTVFAGGQAHGPAGSTHPNFDAIVAACESSRRGEDVDPEDVVPLFDIAATICERFQRLSDRVTVKNGVILLDGDPVHGTLQEQILDFVEEGEDFAPLVNFYEKVLTNPIGDVQDGLYDWIAGQTADGEKVTITEDGDLIGYKGVWPEDGAFRPSRKNTTPMLINDVESPVGTYALQGVGDTVEMPRAVVSEPSHECGIGLHVGTASYARSFGPALLKVKFSPRDVVSAPDSASSWKLRVIRYTVLEVIEDGAAHSTSVYRTIDPDAGEDDGLDLEFDGLVDDLQVGDRLIDADGDEGTVEDDPNGYGDTGLRVRYDDPLYGAPSLNSEDVTDDEPEHAGAFFQRTRKSYSGPTSDAAKGRGKNPAQDAAGRFSNGRPGSQRDSSTGRFVG